MQQHDFAIATEWIEQQALMDFHRVAPETTRKALGLTTKKVGSATLFIARNEPSILLNRVIGLGVGRPALKKEIREIRDRYSSSGILDYFLHIQPWSQPAAIWNWLTDTGLSRGRGWTQFVRGAQPVKLGTTSLRVERIDPSRALDFARIAARGFELTDAAVPALAAMVGLPGWHHFMSFCGDRPAGVAALRIERGLAWFDWAATDLEFRRRGSQTALLIARIRTAIAFGCHTLLSETGEAVPGDPQHSFRNLIRVGFQPTHTRENFVRCGSSTDDIREQAIVN